MTSWWNHNDVIFPKSVFLVFSSYFCAEGQHRQKLMIKNTWLLYYSETQDLEICELGNEEWGRWHSLNTNCCQLSVYFLSYFSRKGSKIYQIHKKSQQKKSGKSKINYHDVIPQISQFASKFVWRHRWRYRLTEKIWDSIFLETIVFKVTKYSITSITIQFNVKNKQEIQISAKHDLQNAVAMATQDPIIKILPHNQIARWIWGKVLWYGRITLNCLKLQTNQSWRGHQKPPPSPPGGIGLMLTV